MIIRYSGRSASRPDAGIERWAIEDKAGSSKTMFGKVKTEHRDRAKGSEYTNPQRERRSSL